MILSDLLLARENAWAKLYVPARIGPAAVLKERAAENVDYPVRLMADRARPVEESLSVIPRADGGLVEISSERVAAFRGDDGQVRLLSPVGSHLGCHVRFNRAERSWDCPCHGLALQCLGRGRPRTRHGAPPALAGKEGLRGAPPARRGTLRLPPRVACPCGSRGRGVRSRS